MKQIIKRLAFLSVVGALALTWNTWGDHDTVRAQQGFPTVTSMYTGSDGLTHFKEAALPPVRQLIKVAGVQFNSYPNTDSTRPAVFQTSARRRYIVTISGKAEFTGSSGNTLFVADRDHIVLAEDVTGKGHTTKATDWVALFIDLDRTGQDGTITQRAGPTVTNMYPGPDGLSHFRELPLPLGKFIEVEGVQFNGPSNGGTGPVFTNATHLRFVVTFSGRAEIVGSFQSKMVVADRDKVLLAEDVTGKGHLTQGYDWVNLFVELNEPQSAQILK